MIQTLTSWYIGPTLKWRGKIHTNYKVNKLYPQPNPTSTQPYYITVQVSHIMRYHKILYVDISYPWPECWGLISSFRIPPRCFSMPNTGQYTTQAGKRIMRTDEGTQMKTETKRRPSTDDVGVAVLRRLKSRVIGCLREYIGRKHR